MKRRYNFLLVLFVITLCVACKDPKAQQSTTVTSQDYNPRYWVEGTTDYRTKPDQAYEAATNKMVDDVYAKGWQGILYWGASRNGDKMNYYYKSPYLEKQPWAVFERDGLSPVISAAHKKGLKVMVNMEGVNPYHWEKNQWTPATIEAAANDLVAAGADAVFEECFEVKSDVFTSLARTLKSKNVNYISGTDPMLLREPNFATLWPETGTINVYNYYLKRDKIYNVATLAQHGSLGLGWAKYWKKPTSLISPVNRNWGIASEYTPAVIPYLCMIRALQFRMDDFIIFGGMDKFDPVQNKAWIQEYVQKQETRPTMNIVVLLKKAGEYTGSETGEASWNRLFNSGDAITSGAFNAGYNIIVSDKVVPADAYWIYTPGGANDVLPADVVALFNTDKPVFLQASSSLPNGPGINPGWREVLKNCGVDGTIKFKYAAGSDSPIEASLPGNQEEEIPYTGYYNDRYLRFTGSDIQRGKDLRAGTVIPKDALKDATIYSAPNKTYGRGPYIAGKNKKYLVTTTSLNWEVAYPISNLLSGGGVAPSSNVWGIAGKNVSAFLAIETTELEVVIPGLADGSKIRVVVWDNKKNKKSEQTVTYKAPYTHLLKEYDFILIDAVK
ncbi:MAG TPA: hypothetical protein VF487_16520 [Chitinophagaceae bacterium]